MTTTRAQTLTPPSTMENVQLTPLSETFVLEIKGLDLSTEPSPALINTLQELLAEHAVLVIRDQSLDENQQNAFTRSLGKQRDQGLHVWAPTPDPEAKVGTDGALGQLPILNNGNQLFFINGPDLCDTDHDPNVILDMKDQYKMQGTSCWHTGDTEKVDVEVVNILYPVIVPEREGHTQFADTMAAYQNMDDETQSQLDKLRMIHCMVFPDVDFIDLPDPTPPVSQPLVKQSPHNGKKFLYLNFHDMDRVVGFDRPASDALIKSLFEQTIREPFLYSHQWQEGDLVVWNCNGTLHRRGLIDPTVQRALRRTQVEVPMLQSTRSWDKTRKAKKHEHDGTYWHPYPLKDD
jgi:alpha-ketoglutarate-dependent taurine dioxygenase